MLPASSGGGRPSRTPTHRAAIIPCPVIAQRCMNFVRVACVPVTLRLHWRRAAVLGVGRPVLGECAASSWVSARDPPLRLRSCTARHPNMAAGQGLVSTTQLPRLPGPSAAGYPTAPEKGATATAAAWQRQCMPGPAPSRAHPCCSLATLECGWHAVRLPSPAHDRRRSRPSFLLCCLTAAGRFDGGPPEMELQVGRGDGTGLAAFAAAAQA